MLEDERDDECVESSSSNRNSEDDIVLPQLIEESNRESKQGSVCTSSAGAVAFYRCK